MGGDVNDSGKKGQHVGDDADALTVQLPLITDANMNQKKDQHVGGEGNARNVQQPIIANANMDQLIYLRKSSLHKT